MDMNMGRILEGGLCRGIDPALWYPEPDDLDGVDAMTAKAVCAECPVSDHCLLFGETTKETREHGIFGGLDEVERARLRRSRARLIRHARERFIRDHS